MPSLAESRRQVNEHLDTEIDHDSILAGLQDEIDKHNAVKDDLIDSISRSKRSHGKSTSERPTKFRFKSSKDERTKHRRSRRDEDDGRHHRRKRRKEDYPTPPQDEGHTEEEASHPFPREPADGHQTDGNAFRTSLFDALADDEGAAAYWESVYSQPIHVYSRPSVENTDTGQMEQMNDDEYVEYVKQKMWERKHPEIVYERKKRERDRKMQEEEQTKRREEFVRRKEQASWERNQRRRFKDDSDADHKDRYEYKFAGEKDWDQSSHDTSKAEQREYLTAWQTYLTSWDKLKLERFEQRNNEDSETHINPSKRIIWPVLKSKLVTKPNIEAFMLHAPADDRNEKLRMLKAERVRWHPDKVQQRFGGAVDEGTMKLVTGVFQLVDGMVEEERKRSGA